LNIELGDIAQYKVFLSDKPEIFESNWVDYEDAIKNSVEGVYYMAGSARLVCDN